MRDIEGGNHSYLYLSSEGDHAQDPIAATEWDRYKHEWSFNRTVDRSRPSGLRPRSRHLHARSLRRRRSCHHHGAREGRVDSEVSSGCSTLGRGVGVISRSEGAMKRPLVASALSLSTVLLTACARGEPVSPASTSLRKIAPTTTSTEPATPSTPSTSNAPSASISAKGAALENIPEAACPKTKEGATAFAKFYFTQLSIGYQRADPSSLDGLFTSTCGTCKNMQNGMREFARLGQHYDAPSIVIDSSDVVVLSESQTRVSLKAHQPVVRLVKNSGEVIRKTKPQEGTFVALLSFDGHWQIHALGTI